MKTTLLLGLFTGSILAATTGEGIKPASKDASALSSLPKDALSLSSSSATASIRVAKSAFGDLEALPVFFACRIGPSLAAEETTILEGLGNVLSTRSPANATRTDLKD
ncbi:hypothetical protein MAC_00260 [Metarhizium acridum CQMa 102]|uniref:Uncharacterized protein n=1 Tax=Metarhizium acridum (strain CQMa 102) TaxID=655827 RepID=E9DR91_METAQ|nr:uncharacterized protein MAC_00260 [Metarhizium acridum CQMa 102]EFY93769.1 hypothetical protein MAC_00260 [Metarhizium acridum CQMa 102]